MKDISYLSKYDFDREHVSPNLAYLRKFCMPLIEVWLPVPIILNDLRYTGSRWNQLRHAAMVTVFNNR